MAYLAGVGTALGPYEYAQQTITKAFADLVLGVGASQSQHDLVERIHGSTGVQHRFLALPLEQYPELTGFGAANDVFLDVGVDMAQAAARQALTKAGLGTQDIDYVMTATVTGIAAPSVDARLVPALGLREDIKRVPVFGLGCVAGASGIARVADYLTGHPDDVALLICVELCSLTVQRDDDSTANIVGAGLFGDGAAAVVMVGERRAARMGLAGPKVVASRSTFYPDTERVMGWDVSGSGFRIVLAPTVADIVRANIGDDVKRFLADNDLDVADVTRWVAHPGGPKVLTALAAALSLTDELTFTWQSLRSVGNLSSASVLHVLRDTLDADPGGAQEPAMLMAMGPGFCAEFVLLDW